MRRSPLAESTVGPAVGGGLTMGRRIDYLDDPDAPEANSLVPSVNVGVINERRRRAADPSHGQRELGAARRGDGHRRDDRRGRRARDARGDGDRVRDRPARRACTRIRGTSCTTRATTRSGRSARSCSPRGRSAASRRRARSLARCAGSRPSEIDELHDARVDAAAGAASARASRRAVHRLSGGRTVVDLVGLGSRRVASADSRRSASAGRTARGVAARAERDRGVGRPATIATCSIAAAYLHDVGYAAELVVHGFHPLDGALLAPSAGPRATRRPGRAPHRREVRGAGARARRRARGVPRRALAGVGRARVQRSDDRTDRRARDASPSASARSSGDTARDSVVVRALEAASDTLFAMVARTERAARALPAVVRD